MFLIVAILVMTPHNGHNQNLTSLTVLLDTFIDYKATLYLGWFFYAFALVVSHLHIGIILKAYLPL